MSGGDLYSIRAIPRFGIDAHQVELAPVQHPIYAIVIDGSSEADRAIISERTPGFVAAPFGDDGSDDEGGTRVIRNAAVDRPVSVERPLLCCYPPGAKLLVRAPYSDHARAGAGTRAFMRPGLLNATPYATMYPSMPELVLQLWHCPPSWLPTRRAPLEYVFSTEDFVGLAADHPYGASGTTLLEFPYMGRTRAHLFISLDDRSAGSFTWSARVANRIQNAPPLTVSGQDESVLGGATLSADGVVDQTFTDRGPDWFRIYLTQSSLNAGAKVAAVLQLYDEC